MSPKGKPGKENDETAWRRRIEEAELDEETWKVKVIFMESAGSDQDRIYLTKFEAFAAEERRFVVKNICKTETIFMINQLGAEKKIKDENFRVFEEGQAYLKEKKDIPPDILALIIKHLILKMKEEYLFIRRQRIEVKEGLRRESTTMMDKAEYRSAIVTAKPPDVPTKKTKKGEPDALPEPEEGKKYNTVLRERGEEWRDRVYVDDFPLDGPSLYVAVTGFVEPYLPICLVQIGIPLTAVVQIRINPTTVRVPSTLIRPTKRGQSQTEMITEKSLNFWEQIQDLRINKETADDLKNSAFIIFNPPYWDSDTVTGNPDKIYDEVCFLMYDIQDLSRQHFHYLENMDIIQIPEAAIDARYFWQYQRQIDDLPLESVTIYSLLDSIRKISSKHNLDEQDSKTSLSTPLTLKQLSSAVKETEKVQKAKALVRNVFNNLCRTDTEKKSYRVTYGEEFENYQDPILIKYGDFARYPTFHIKNINLESIVGSTLYKMPLHNLWQTQKSPTAEAEAKINFHVNMLLSCFDRTDVETAELNRLLHILSFRKLYNNRSSLKKHHLQSQTINAFKKLYLKRSMLAEPLPRCPSLVGSLCTASPSFPSMTKCEDLSDVTMQGDTGFESYRIKFLFDCTDISELVSAAEIANDQPISHMIDDYEFFEDFSGVCAFQILREAFNKFNCVDYKYCEVSDCILLMFFNSHDKDGITRDEWRCHLPTPLCLQDFFDFVLEENFDWIQNEEKQYDESVFIRKHSICQEVIDPLATVSCIEDTNIEMDMLIEGSLKYQEYIQAEESTQDGTEKKDPNIFTSAKRSASSPSSEADSKNSKKSKSSESSPRKRQSYVPDEVVEEGQKPFLGYDLGDRRFEVFGKDARFFSKDGTYVSTNYILLIPSNVEFLTLNLTPGNFNNEFWLHKALGDFVDPEIRRNCESFRITSKDNVMMNIKKQYYQELLAPIGSSSKLKEARVGRESARRASEKSVNTQLFETNFFYSFCITWPNGLITESVHDSNSNQLSHIKQFHVLSPYGEDMRCISLNGEVIVFLTSGDVEVLRPDGTFIRITKFEKRVVIPEPPPEEFHEESSEDKKKAKGKNKEKPVKGKQVEKDKSVEGEEKPIEYELHIDEYEIIETSGLRQKWVLNDSFDIEKLVIRTATEHCLGEVFSRRQDGTNMLLNKDGLLIVTFPNKTRIITQYVIEKEEIYPEWTKEEIDYFEMFDTNTVEDSPEKSRDSVSQSQRSHISGSSNTASKKLEEEEEEKERTDGYISIELVFTIEHQNFTSVTIDKINDKITIDSPNNSSLTVNSHNHFEFLLDNATKATFNGETLRVNYEACSECKSYTTCDVKIENDLNFEKNATNDINNAPLFPSWVKIRDSFCKNVVVNIEGGIEVLDEPCSNEALGGILTEDGDTPCEEPTNPHEENSKADWKSESSVTSHGRCRDAYQSKNFRFMVLNRDLTCSELVHRGILEQYQQACRWQPWCNVSDYETFGDNRVLRSILTPVSITESEKWVMESKLAGKPKHLKYKDLKPDSGKGFYHWMRPYERFEPVPLNPDLVLTHKIPRAFILRTLEQQWRDKDREGLKGAKELLVAILRYRHMIETESEMMLRVPIIDLRLEDERKMDELVQAFGQRLYNELNKKLEEDVQSRAKATITTRPPPSPESISFEGEIVEEEEIDPRKVQVEERENALKDLGDAAQLNTNLLRYWRRRAEEKKEEDFYWHLLREGSVPQYFRNIVGGAIWWEMNQAAGEAVDMVERRKMKCVCEYEATVDSSHSAEFVVPTESQPLP